MFGFNVRILQENFGKGRAAREAERCEIEEWRASAGEVGGHVCKPKKTFCEMPDHSLTKVIHEKCILCGKCAIFSAGTIAANSVANSALCRNVIMHFFTFQTIPLHQTLQLETNRSGISNPEAKS